YWTNEMITGGSETTVETPIEKMPIFIKAGTVLAEYPVMQYVNEKTIEVLDLVVYYTEGEAESVLYEDQGDSYAYESKIYLEKTFTVNGTSETFEISLEMEGLFTEPYQEYNVKIVGMPFKATHIFA